MIRLKDEEGNKRIELHRQGYGTYEIARKLGKDPSTIAEWKNRRGMSVSLNVRSKVKGDKEERLRQFLYILETYGHKADNKREFIDNTLRDVSCGLADKTELEG